MKTAVIIGAGSHIYNGIKPSLKKDYELIEFFGERPNPDVIPKWNVMLIFMGKVAPVGNWWEASSEAFDACIISNLTKPMSMIRKLWHLRKEDATVIWLSGSNPQGIMAGYAPYNTAKMAVNKLIEQLDHDTPEAKFVAFGPGYVRDSKIHNETRKKNWPNPRMDRGDAGTPLEEIYNGITWCIKQPKSLVGGRNICASDLLGVDDDDFIASVMLEPNLYKLRRVQ